MSVEENERERKKNEILAKIRPKLAPIKPLRKSPKK